MKKQGADHLIMALKSKHEVTQYWSGSLYCDITLKCNYKSRLLNISMPSYATNLIHKFQHPTPTRPQNSPNKWTPSNYGSTVPQMAQQPVDSPALKAAEVNTVHQVVVTFIYYVRTVYPIMLVALNIIKAEQASSTETIDKKWSNY